MPLAPGVLRIEADMIPPAAYIHALLPETPVLFKPGSE
jgi:hypothetical protein